MGFEPTRAEPSGLAVHLLNLSAPLVRLAGHPCSLHTSVADPSLGRQKKLSDSTRIGFEPKRAEPNGLAVHPLNHSTTSSALQAIRAAYTLVSKTYHWENKNKVTRLDEDGIRTHAGSAQWISSPSP
ncbi:hypothetical protein MRX96_015305 [Rhipicephalus microplus]